MAAIKSSSSATTLATNSTSPLSPDGGGGPTQAVAVKTDSNGDTFLRLWRYLTVGGRGPRDRGCHRLGRHRGHAKIRSRSSDVLARDGLALGSKIVPAFLQNLPVVLVVGAPKNHGPHFDARISAPVSPALMSRSSFCDHRLPTDAIDTANLLLDDARIPLGMGSSPLRQTPNAIHASSACFVASNDFLS